MALPFFKSAGGRKKLQEIVAVDLGSRSSKAVYLQRSGEQIALSGYTLLDAPIFEKMISAELLTEHLKNLGEALKTKTRSVILTIGATDALVRAIETPRIPMEDLRPILKHNSRNYLQEDLSSYVFDCQLLPELTSPAATQPQTGEAVPQKQRVLVAGAKQQLVEQYVTGARKAGFTLESIVPSLVGPINALEVAMPEVFTNESVALVDLGFKSTSICLLHRGELVVSRVVGIGGDRFTQAVSEAMNISYAEAEGLKVGMPQEIHSTLEALLTPLGRELRASIDFFEHQHDQAVTKVLVCGGSSRSELVVQALQTELMLECVKWDPIKPLQGKWPPQQAAEIEQIAPQLAVAVGAGLAAL
jgi:type IV pilus assembly protein PilM